MNDNHLSRRQLLRTAAVVGAAGTVGFQNAERAHAQTLAQMVAQASSLTG